MMNKMMSVAAFAAALTLTASCALAAHRRRDDRRPEYRKDSPRRFAWTLLRV